MDEQTLRANLEIERAGRRAAEERLAEAVGVVRSVEWRGPGGTYDCPSCGETCPGPHAPDCELARVLARAQ